jgi:hypothetical protein
MPAFVKSRFGASGNRGEDGTIVCFFSRKKSRNDCRISAEVMLTTNKHEVQKIRNPQSERRNDYRPSISAGKLPASPRSQ